MSKVKVIIELTVEAPEGSEPEQVRKAINSMLDCGYADAADTADDASLNSAEAEFITNLTIHRPSIQPC